MFDAYEWDFGQVNASLGAICHTFTLENKSKQPVTIAKTVSTCDCIQARYAGKAIEPGAKARVMVVFSPATSEGKTFRSVELLDANGRTLGALSVKATVSHSAAQQGTKPAYPYSCRVR